MLRSPRDAEVISEVNHNTTCDVIAAPERRIVTTEFFGSEKQCDKIVRETLSAAHTAPCGWTESETHMATHASSIQKKDHKHGNVGLGKTARGVQTDQTYRPPKLLNPEKASTSRSDTAHQNAPLKSVPRRVAPTVSFPRWSGGNEKSRTVSALTEQYLGALYQPYALVKKPLTQQALTRYRTLGHENFEAHFLGPTAMFLRTVKDRCSLEALAQQYGKIKGIRVGMRKRCRGWPLNSRRYLIVHLSDPDSSVLRSSDFYFVASPVGIAVRWVKETSGHIEERSLDVQEFCSEMMALLNFEDKDNGNHDEKVCSVRKNLLVVSDKGIHRIQVSRLTEELLGSRSKRKVIKNTQDSGVQTDKNLFVSALKEPKQSEPLQIVAPLASEEEFCSDSDQKQKPTFPSIDFTAGDVPNLNTSALREVKQASALEDLNRDVLFSQVAVMPGCKDTFNRSIIYITLKKLKEYSINSVQLAEVLLYFQSITKIETMRLGFLAVVNGHQAETEEWLVLHKALAFVEECAPATVSLVLALHKQSQKSESFSSKFSTFQTKLELIVNENQLLKYVSKGQLLPEFGGTFEYIHENWIKFHEFLDPFIACCHEAGCRLMKLIHDLRSEQLPATLTTHLIEQHKKQIMEVLEDKQLRYLKEEGPSFLRELEKYKQIMGDNSDYKEAVEKAKALYSQLKKVVERLGRFADEKLNKLQENMMMKVFEEESSQVLTWLHHKGEETLQKHKKFAETPSAIKKQENEFEKFYFLAMRQIERGNDLLEEIPKCKEDNPRSLSAQLKCQLDDFTDRLEDVREKLEDTSRCYKLLDQVYSWALDIMQYMSHMKVRSTTSLCALEIIMKRLDAYLETRPYIKDEVFEEMRQIATKLNNGKLLDQCQVARSKYEEIVELIHARQDFLLKAQKQMNCDVQLSVKGNIDDLKTKPCLWNPLSPKMLSRTISYSSLGVQSLQNRSHILKREPLGSYTSFPSNYYPVSGFKDDFIGLSQKRNQDDFFFKRISLTDDHILSFTESLSAESSSDLLYAEKSYPVYNDTSSNIDVRSDKERDNAKSHSEKPQLNDDGNWTTYEDELKKYADEVKQQNYLLEYQQLLGQSNSSNSEDRENNRRCSSKFSARSSLSTLEENGKFTPMNTHLFRHASCSDFEELFSSKATSVNSPILKNNRTLKLIMLEMIHTERDYVKSLGYIIENYLPLLQSNDVNQALRSQRNVIFGNIEKIYEFHNNYFSQELEQCESTPYAVGQCFLKYETQFYLYALYNKNKPKSDHVMVEYGNIFFKQKQQELEDKMDLASYLLKPVQRMGKYALLLKQLLKECSKSNSEYYDNLKAAEEMVCFQLRHGNDLLAMDAIRECDVNIKEQGRLLRQEEFLVWQGKSRKALRRVFLFEDLILFSKARRDPERMGHDYYQYKSCMKTSDLGLTAQVGESPTKFEIWFRKCKAQDLYILQAPSAEVKHAWVEEITGLLWKQAERNRKLRLLEMSSMGIGNKPCLDITPNQDQICDRSISLQQLSKVPRFRNSVVIPSSDNFNNNETQQRPLSITSLGRSSSSGDCNGAELFYDIETPLIELEKEELSKCRSVTQNSQCSAESGIFTDLSTSGDSYSENVQRLKVILRSESMISHAPYGGTEAIPREKKQTEVATALSSCPSLIV